MKPLLLAIFLASPAFAGGIAEPVHAPEQIAGCGPNNRLCMTANHANEGRHQNPVKGEKPKPTPCCDPIDPPKPVDDTKRGALARVYGIENGNWKSAPDGGAAVKAHLDKRTAEEKGKPQNDRNGDGKVDGREARDAAMQSGWAGFKGDK